jgi:hypothetical protein
MADKGQNKETKSVRTQEFGSSISDFVLDKVIFSNVFEKDIRRIYIYRKSERLAKALQLITPAFNSAPSLRNRLDGSAVGLIDAAILPPSLAREALSRELLALSSLLAVARAGGLLSEMNANLIIREAHLLLQEIASYEEPRLFLGDAPTLAELAKRAPDMRDLPGSGTQEEPRPKAQAARSAQAPDKGQNKRHVSDTASSTKNTDRQSAILAILRSKGSSYIKDISTLIRDVSEKTVQRELQSLVNSGLVQREGERRWTQYSLIDTSS